MITICKACHDNEHRSAATLGCGTQPRWGKIRAGPLLKDSATLGLDAAYGHEADVLVDLNYLCLFGRSDATELCVSMVEMVKDDESTKEARYLS